MADKSELDIIEANLRSSSEVRRAEALAKLERLISEKEQAYLAQENLLKRLSRKHGYLLGSISFGILGAYLIINPYLTTLALKRILLIFIFGFPILLFWTKKVQRPHRDFSALYRPLLACHHPEAIPLLLSVMERIAFTGGVEISEAKWYPETLCKLLPKATQEIAARLSRKQWQVLHTILYSYTDFIDWVFYAQLKDVRQVARFVTRFGSKEDLEELSDWLMSVPDLNEHRKFWNLIVEEMLPPMLERTLADASLLSTLDEVETAHQKLKRALRSQEYDQIYRRNYFSLWYLLENRPFEPLPEEALQALLRLLSEREPIHDTRLPLAIIDTLGKAKETAALPLLRTFLARKKTHPNYKLIAQACKRWISVLEEAEQQQEQAKTLLRAGPLDEGLLRAAAPSTREETPEHLLRKNVEG